MKTIHSKKYRNQKWLTKKFKVERLSVKQIAKICNVNYSTVKDWLNK